MPSNDSVRLHEIQIRNVMGITELEIRPGQVTIIEGKNGSGKTSILGAIRAAIGGGHDATLLRNGSSSGEVVLLLEDGKRIEKRIGRERSSSTVTDPERGKIAKPQTFMDDLIDKFSLNPIDFLSSKAAQRVELLLESLPMKLSEMDVIDALELCASKHDLSGHALQVIQAIAKDLYDQRTGVNRTLKDKISTIAEMKKALPEEVTTEVDYAGEVEAAQTAYLDFQKDVLERRAAISANCTALQRRNESASNAEIKSLEQERDRRIAEIREDFELRISGAGTVCKAVLQNAQEAKDGALAELQAAVDGKEQPLKDRIADARAKSETNSRSASTRKHLETLKTGAKVLESDSENLTAALAQLDELKSALLERLPIKGMELRDSDIYLDGVPFDRVNEARKVQVAIEVAQLRSGRLPLIVVDGLERLDSATFAAFIAEVKTRNIQLIATRVTEGKLQVTTA